MCGWVAYNDRHHHLRKVHIIATKCLFFFFFFAWTRRAAAKYRKGRPWCGIFGFDIIFPPPTHHCGLVDLPNFFARSGRAIFFLEYGWPADGWMVWMGKVASLLGRLIDRYFGSSRTGIELN